MENSEKRKNNPDRENGRGLPDSECNDNKKTGRVSLVGIIVEDTDSVARINSLLHQYGSYIIGRMGVPHHDKKMNIISVVMDAPQDVVSSLSGKLGMLPGVSSKCLYAKQ